MPTLRVPSKNRSDLKIAYRDEGSGEPVLMLMGLGAQLIFWPEGLVERLLESGLRIIRIDNRDAGESSHLEGEPTPSLATTLMRRALGLEVQAAYDLYDMANDAVAVLDELRLARAHVVGSSMGGMIAQILATRHATRVASLTSIMSSGGDLADLRPAPRAWRVALGRNARDDKSKAETIVRTYKAIAGRRWGRDETLLRAMAREAVTRGISDGGMARQFAAIAKTGNRHHELANIRVKTQLIHGTDDPLVRPRAARALQRAIPGAELHWIKGMGHGLPRPAWPQLSRLITQHVESSSAQDDRAANPGSLAPRHALRGL